MLVGGPGRGANQISGLASATPVAMLLIQVFVSQVDLGASRFATADWPHAEFGLDVNVLCRLFDEQAVWQYSFHTNLASA